MAYDAPNLIIHRSWCVAFTNVEAFIQDQGTFVMSLMASLFRIEVETMIYYVAALFIGLTDIASIVVKLNHSNDISSKVILKVLLYDLYTQ